MGCAGSKDEGVPVENAATSPPTQSEPPPAKPVQAAAALADKPVVPVDTLPSPSPATATADGALHNPTVSPKDLAKDHSTKPVDTSDQAIKIVDHAERFKQQQQQLHGATSVESTGSTSTTLRHQGSKEGSIFSAPSQCSDHGILTSPVEGVPTLADKPTSSLARTATQLNIPPDDLLKDVQHLTWLGQGAYGAVYQGIWHGAYVAVKFIPSDTVDPESASFREAQLSTLLAHPNVVQAFWTRCSLLTDAFMTASIGDERSASSGRTPMRPDDYISGDGFGDPYGNDKGKQVFMMRDVLQQLNCKPGQYLTVIAMEYCDKGSLHQVIYKSVFKATDKWSDRIALRALIRSAREIAQGVWHLHNSGVIHGDLKPGNVLLKGSRSDRRGFVCKVSDFGLARETFGQSDIHASRWATINYMAPEHFEGLLSKASDVYSFAVVIWEMYNAERPYRDYTQGQVMMGVRTGELRPTWPAAAPEPLVRLTSACLQQDPAQRPTFESIMQQLTNIEGDMRMEEYSKRNAAGKAPGATTSAAATAGEGQPTAAQAQTAASFSSPLNNRDVGVGGPMLATEQVVVNVT